MPVQVKPPVMSGDEVGVPWLGNCGVFVKASGAKRVSIPVDDVLQAVGRCRGTG